MKDKTSIASFENTMAGQNLDIVENLRNAQKEKFEKAKGQGFEEEQQKKFEEAPSEKLKEHKMRLTHRTIMNEKFLEKLVDYQYITEQTAQEIKQIIENDSLLHKAYIVDSLFISTATRIGVTNTLNLYEKEDRQYIEKNKESAEKEEKIKNLETLLKKMNNYYDEGQECELRLLETFRAIQEYKPSNNLAQLYNDNALDVIMQHEAGEDVEKKKFGISIEIFPSISFEPGIDYTLGRFDCYNLRDNIIKVCPNNLPEDNGIPARTSTDSLFAHELAHAVDDIINRDNLSTKGLELTIRKYFPTIDATNVNEAKTALTNAAELYDNDFNNCYGVEKIIDKSYELNLETGGATNGAATEFVSFFAQSVSERLNELKEGQDFEAVYRKYIQKQINKISPDRDKLFALDVMSNCSQAYISRFTDLKVQQLFVDVNKVIREKKEEINTEDLVRDIKADKIDKSITVFVPENFDEENTQHIALRTALQEAGISFKEKAHEKEQNVIEPYLYLEQKIFAELAKKQLEATKKRLEEIKEREQLEATRKRLEADLKKLQDEDAEKAREKARKQLEDAPKNKVTDEFIKKIESGEVKAVWVDEDTEWGSRVLSAGLGKGVRVFMRSNTEAQMKRYEDRTNTRVILFNPDLNQSFTPPEKEAISESKTYAINITPEMATGTPTIQQTPSVPPTNNKISEADINKEIASTTITETLTITSKELVKNAKIDSKRGKQNLTQVEKEHLTNLLQAEIEGSDKYNLTERLAAVNDNHELLNKLDSEAVITANIGFKAIDAQKSAEIGKVEIRGEKDHLADHKSNNDKLTDEIQNGIIKKDTIIAIERKQYGKNLGMQDVIKLAGILKHNENNPNNPIKLPQELENTPILHDAILYKTADEKGIKVISLEGRNLEHGKNSGLQDENREQYMADVINEARNKGYNVVANVGSSHENNLKKALEKNQQQSRGLSNIPRELKQKPTDDNVKEISESILQKSDVAIQQSTTMNSTAQTATQNEAKKEELTNFASEQKLDEKGKYNLKASIAAVNDNQDLELIFVRAAVKADAGLKAINAKESVEAEKAGSFEMRAGGNYATKFSDLSKKVEQGSVEHNSQEFNSNTLQDQGAAQQSTNSTEQTDIQNKNNIKQRVYNIKRRLSAVSNQFSSSRSESLNTHGKRQNINSVVR